MKERTIGGMVMGIRKELIKVGSKVKADKEGVMVIKES